ncbi:sensor histidine kinase KdpD [Acaryochloris sp. CCMEE 5410]|uniref:sensor histidine kinase n=1 Tax=Acaryochloris sp. CCMEE 5410 TaxID=310037 RepID=UPI0002484ECA|nr:HAMP domain-containing sensor histidine kinase [Acaryochloris sp. CCMEE 5410]KAI9132288.1 HAMP domain-containing histidine kinase [Acaryochloris sp. CCMEE 5410]
MSQILLLFDQQENGRLLAQWLSQFYLVLSPPCEQQVQALAEEPFDLAVFDGTALLRLLEPLQVRRQVAEPIFLPCLLVTPQPDPERENLSPSLWKNMDEEITIPCSQAILQRRIEMLLRARRLSVELNEANIQLQKANKLQSQFVNLVSHEFRNSLHAISGFVQMLELQYTQSSETVQKIFKRLYNAIQKSDKLTADLLILGRTGANRLEFKPEQLNLELLCRSITETAQANDSFQRQVDLAINGDCSAVVMDGALIEHALTNLVSNALKYSLPDGVVRVTLKIQNQRVVINVQDTGIGIPAEDQAQLFQSFHRASNVGQIPGTGLGLAIVQQCVSLHRGQIFVDSQVGRGTTFTVQLPLT